MSTVAGDASWGTCLEPTCRLQRAALVRLLHRSVPQLGDFFGRTARFDGCKNGGDEPGNRANLRYFSSLSIQERPEELGPHGGESAHHKSTCVHGQRQLCTRASSRPPQMYRHPHRWRERQVPESSIRSSPPNGSASEGGCRAKVPRQVPPVIKRRPTNWTLGRGRAAHCERRRRCGRVKTRPIRHEYHPRGGIVSADSRVTWAFVFVGPGGQQRLDASLAWCIR
jgi:hypothetical protein